MSDEVVDAVMLNLYTETYRSPLESKSYPLLGGYEDLYTESGEPDVVYLSTPITTGPAMIEYLRAGGDANPDLHGDLVRSELMRDNLSALVPIRENVITSFRKEMLIDPTDLTVPGWSQREYMRFWAEVMELFADHIVFADGWALSTGCTFEFMVAWSLGIPMYDSDCQLLSSDTALVLLNNALTTLEEVSRDSQMQAEAMELIVSDLVEEYTL